MPTDCVIAADFCLFFGCETTFARNVILDLWNFAAFPLIQMIVFLYCSWSFPFFNHNSHPFLYSFFFLKVWISLSKIYRRTLALTWAPSLPDLHMFVFWWTLPPSTPPKCERNNWMPPLLFLSNILKKGVIKLIFCMQINFKVSCQLILTLLASKFPTRWYYQYWWAWSSILKVLKVTSFAISSQYLKKEVRDGVHFCMQINIKVSTSWHYHFWWKWPDMFKVPRIGSW